MISLTVDNFAAYFIIVALCVVIGLSVFYDYIEGRHYAKRCIQSLFYCKKCNCILSINEAVELYECPKCGVKNMRLKF